MGMRLIFMMRWVIVVLSLLIWAAAFATLFVGGSAVENRVLLVLNLILVVVQIVNIFIAYTGGRDNTGAALVVCLAITLFLLCVTYVCNWDYTMGALSEGSEWI